MKRRSGGTTVMEVAQSVQFYKIKTVPGGTVFLYLISKST